MDKTNAKSTKRVEMQQKVKPVLVKIRFVWNKVWEIWGLICDWIIRLRKVLMMVPVALAAVIFAVRNMRMLPPMVGLGLRADGEFAYLVARHVAVFGPMSLTFACLLLMIFSRKTVYPWLISIFTLILPPLILVFNNFLG